MNIYRSLFFVLIISLSTTALAMPAPTSGPAEAAAYRPKPKAPAVQELPPQAKFTVDVPEGWVADNNSGTYQGVGIVFYPKGGSWNGSPAVMYVRSADKIGVSLQKTIDDDIAHYKENAPQIVASDESGLFTRDDKLAVVKKLKDNNSGNLEYIAYVAEDKSASVITLNAQSEKDARGAYAAFKELVNSYHLLNVKKKEMPLSAPLPTPTPAPTPAPVKKVQEIKKAEPIKKLPVVKPKQIEYDDEDDDDEDDDEDDENNDRS